MERLDGISIQILKDILIASTSSTDGVNAQKFRAKNHKYMQSIDSLESSRYIENRNGKYFIELTTLPDIADSTPEVVVLLDLCERLFQLLRQTYLDNPGESISLDELSKLANLPRQEIYIGIEYLHKASIFSGYTSDISSKDALVIPSEKVLRHESFNQVIEEIRGWAGNSVMNQRSFNHVSDIIALGGNSSTFEQLLHPIITQHALQQYLDGHLRDAVLNSIIAVFDLIRQKTGLHEDGDVLIGKAFSLDTPYLVLSEIETESGKNDQKGFMQIFKGTYQGIRNPKAHSLSSDLTQVGAAQYLVFASLLARRIDEAIVREVSQANLPKKSATPQLT